MAELIWWKILLFYLSPMTTAEGGNPSRWTGGMRRRLSYGERLLLCPLQGWLCEHETCGHQKQVWHWLSLWETFSMLLILMTTSSMLKKLSNSKISYEPNVTLIKSAYEFINITLVCDDDRYKAHKAVQLSSRNINSKIYIGFPSFTINQSFWSLGWISYLAVGIIEAFLVMKGVSVFCIVAYSQVDIYLLFDIFMCFFSPESKSHKILLCLQHNISLFSDQTTKWLLRIDC